MARPENNTVDYFPKWKPTKVTVINIKSHSYRDCYKAMRSSSSAFIKNKSVREFVFNRDNYKCSVCGSTSELQVDHIESVHSVALKFYGLNIKDYHFLNSAKNLQTLCKSCNSSKSPTEACGVCNARTI